MILGASIWPTGLTFLMRSSIPGVLLGIVCLTGFFAFLSDGAFLG